MQEELNNGKLCSNLKSVLIRFNYTTELSMYQIERERKDLNPYVFINSFGSLR